ncbi:MAG: hypothetical protein EZS28_026405 [Streblomastix strix]|uniref:Uncharacterized protein n=1 Tax=Streblomastix strix TaxID=222440 RepID=A0A5J4V5G4_9EUKA|nr:MAG: hypothetical protein EZS28_026405 [Streblomastix strix]
MPKNPVQPEPSELELSVNFDTQNFTVRTPTTVVVEQSEPKDGNRKFFQSEHQPTLHDIERQVTSKQTISERSQTIMAKLLKVITRTYITEIDFSTTNIQDEQNGEADRKEICNAFRY